MKIISKSVIYKPAIIIATILAMLIICYIFYYITVRYLQWKNSKIPKESFLDGKTDVGIVSMIREPKNIDTWLDKHRTIGIKHFYIRLEQTPDLEDYLKKQEDVTLQIGESSGINEYEEIQNRQSKWVNEAFKLARNDNNGVKWLFHIDCDEILRGNLHEIAEYPEDVRTFWIQNEEAKFSKVPSSKDNCFSASKLVDCSKDSKNCVSYGNGKGCGRVGEDVESNGPHRMKSKLEKKSKKNKTIVVEHYESCDFDIFKKKFKNLAVQDNDSKIPFSYYNESIEACKENNDDKLYKIYEKYRIVQ